MKIFLLTCAISLSAHAANFTSDACRAAIRANHSLKTLGAAPHFKTATEEMTLMPTIVEFYIRYNLKSVSTNDICVDKFNKEKYTVGDMVVEISHRPDLVALANKKAGIGSDPSPAEKAQCRGTYWSKQDGSWVQGACTYENGFCIGYRVYLEKDRGRFNASSSSKWVRPVSVGARALQVSAF